MTPSPNTRLLALAAASLALAVPASAQAAESFVAVTGGDHLVGFHSDTAPGLSAPVAIRGLPAGARIAALDTRPQGGLIALTGTGTVLAVDAVRHAVTGTVATLPLSAPADAATTLTVAADGRSARAIAGGRDVTFDLASGVVTRDVPAGAALALDAGADGVLRGLDPARGAVVSLDGAGEHDLAVLPDLKPSGPSTATTAADGATYMVTGLPRRNAPRQSRIVRFDPATGAARGHGSYFLRQLDAVAATGAVADDTRAPKVTVRIPRQSVRSALRAHGVVADVTTSEGGQTVMSARAGKAYGFGLGTVDLAGRMRVVAHLSPDRIHASAGRRMRVHLAVHDWAGNVKNVDTYVRLAR
jgi:hypothetical protein